MRLLLLFLIPLMAAAVPESALIPRPVLYQATEGSFALSKQTRVALSDGLPAFHGTYLVDQLAKHTGISATVVKSGGLADINVRLNTKLEHGYTLKVTPQGVTLEGKDAELVFAGIQTLLQLAALGSDQKIAACDISDYPRYSWRGMMLDSSRHFQTVEEVKVLLDQMAFYKLNVFHWHLTDDQGWRIEIKSRPKLTEIGAWRVPRQGIWWTRPRPMKDEKATDGGFYTQAQIREVVAYATARHITVMPEIDVPGHSLAILAAYPELGTTKGPFYVVPGSKFYGEIENTLDPSNPETFKFLEDVFGEIAPLFTSPFIHMGGDECHKGFWNNSEKVRAFMKEKGLKNAEELQSWFVKQTEAIIRSKGKRLMGWDEILEGGLAEGASVMSWQSTAGGIAAARMGRDVVMSPQQGYYLDLYQGDPEIEPPTYSRARLIDTYWLDCSVPADIDARRILGIQGNIWTESIPNFHHLQYMTWPRGWAIAEEAWSPARNRQTKDAQWTAFISRVERHFTLFDRCGWICSHSIYDPDVNLSTDGRTLRLTPEIPGLDIHYTFDDTEPSATSPKAIGPLPVPIGASSIRTRTYRDGKPVGRLTWIKLANIKKS